MGLDDLVDDSKEDQKQKEVENAAEELGIDNLKELEQFSDSVQNLRQLLVIHDRRLEEIDRLNREIEDLRVQVGEIEEKINVIAEKIKDAD